MAAAGALCYSWGVRAGEGPRSRSDALTRRLAGSGAATALAGAGGALTLLSGVWALGLPAAWAGAGQEAGVHTVVLKGLRFRPSTVSIRRGESVTWLWRDGRIEHNVAFGALRSRTQASGSYTVRFTRRGTFGYECTLHVAEGMHGKVIVH